MMEEANDEGEKMKKNDNTIANITERQDAFHRKWAAPLLLGPFVPAIFSMIIVVGGTITLNGRVGVCGYPLAEFISGAIFISYLFLILYSWIFLGDNFSVYVPIFGNTVTVLKPITSLSFVIYMYLFLGIGSFICWSVGSFYVAQGIFCGSTAPLLYSFALFIVVIYWIGFFIIIFYIFKLKFGHLITASIVESTRAPTEDELEEQIFRKSFQKMDVRKRNKIDSTDLPKLFSEIGVYVADEDLPDLQQTLDPTDSGEIEFYALLKWFKQFREAAKIAEARNKKAEGVDKGGNNNQANDDSDEEDDDDDDKKEK